MRWLRGFEKHDFSEMAKNAVLAKWQSGFSEMAKNAILTARFLMFRCFKCCDDFLARKRVRAPALDSAEHSILWRKKMLHFAANLSMLFSDSDWAARFSRARAAGFSTVEIQFPYEMPVDELKKYLKNNGLSLCLINLPAGDLMTGGAGLAALPTQKKAFRAALDQALFYVEALNIPRVNCLAGRATDRAAAWETLVENLDFAAEKLANVGAVLMCEAINPFDMPNFLVNSGEDMRRLATDLGRKNFGAQVDVYHFARQNLDALQWILDNLSIVEHVQFADCPNRGEPGSGSIDFAHFFASLERIHFQKILAAEYRPTRKTEDTLSWLTF